MIIISIIYIAYPYVLIYHNDDCLFVHIDVSILIPVYSYVLNQMFVHSYLLICHDDDCIFVRINVHILIPAYSYVMIYYSDDCILVRIHVPILIPVYEYVLIYQFMFIRNDSHVLMLEYIQTY